MAALEMSEQQTADNSVASGPASGKDKGHQERLLDITNRVHSASNIDEILIDLRDDIIKLFEAERLTIYVVDGIKKDLVSRVKSGDEISEIRVPISTTSLAGYSAYKGRLVNINNVYDEKELAAIDPKLNFDKSWDERTGFRTRQALVAPVSFQKYLMGAIQLVNRKDGKAFTERDEAAVQELSQTLGIALFNQKRMAKARPGKFDYLIENGLLTQKEADKAVLEARKTRQEIEDLLMKSYKISKKDIGQALSHYYRTPFVEYNERVPIPGDLLAGLKVPFMKKNNWVPIGQDQVGKKVIIAIDNPYHLQKVDMIKPLFPDKEIIFHVALKEDIDKFLTLFYQDDKELSSIEDIIGQLEVEEDEIDAAEKGVTEEDSTVVQLVNKMILDAHERDASDIHIEPYHGKQPTEVRIRVDGALQVYQTVPYNYRAAVVSRIKIMADLDIAERRKPQDGKIKFKKYGGKDLELRVAVVPT